MIATPGLSRPLHFPFILIFIVHLLPQSSFAQVDNPAPPSHPVKLIFIHHSTGENWLTDGYGDLGRTLAENNYFVSDSNYGWGPDNIGDRTDIPNWLEWFRSEQTPTYMAALFNESAQNASYTRSFSDPGGENTIIMFKSCFPNSALEGSPDDLPDPDGWLSVGHARYVYNEILKYFATRPDKLFVVITAPPLSDGTYAANARAFNNWLLNDWLNENDYTLNNVAVFDFYNVLTSPDAHHRYSDGQIEHATTARNTLAYPSGDDHPSVKGSRKATQEFVSLLNVYYQRWHSKAPEEPAVAVGSSSEPAATSSVPAVGQETIDTFESVSLLSSSCWQAYWDESTATQISCELTADRAHSGEISLQVDYDLASESWATCDLSFDQPQNWAGAEGIGLFLFSGQAGQTFNVDIFTGSTEPRATYTAAIQAPLESTTSWISIFLRWQDFRRVAWEDNPGETFTHADAVQGIAFGFSDPSSGTLWIDDISLMQGEPLVVPTTIEINMEESGEPTPGSTNKQAGRPCAFSVAAPLMLVGIAWLGIRKRSVPR